MNQNKLNLTQALVVEGKYDAARLANLVDAKIGRASCRERV